MVAELDILNLGMVLLQEPKGVILQYLGNSLSSKLLDSRRGLQGVPSEGEIVLHHGYLFSSKLEGDSPNSPVQHSSGFNRLSNGWIGDEILRLGPISSKE